MELLEVMGSYWVVFDKVAVTVPELSGGVGTSETQAAVSMAARAA